MPDALLFEPAINDAPPPLMDVQTETIPSLAEMIAESSPRLEDMLAEARRP